MAGLCSPFSCHRSVFICLLGSHWISSAQLQSIRCSPAPFLLSPSTSSFFASSHPIFSLLSLPLLVSRFFVSFFDSSRSLNPCAFRSPSLVWIKQPTTCQHRPLLPPLPSSNASLSRLTRHSLFLDSVLRIQLDTPRISQSTLVAG